MERRRSAGARRPTRGPAHPAPTARPREPACSLLVAGALAVGSVSLGGDGRRSRRDTPRCDRRSGRSRRSYAWSLPRRAVRATSLQVLAGRRTDQVLLPTVGLLGGSACCSWSGCRRTSSPSRSAAGRSGSAQVQLRLAGPGALDRRGSLGDRRSARDAWLRLYKYTWAAVGIGLLLLTFVFGRDVNGAAADAHDRAAQRPAVRAAQGDPRRLPRRLPVGEPAAPDGAGHARRAAPPAAVAVPRCRWSRCGRSPSASSSSSATSGRRCCSSRSSCSLLYVATARASYVVIGLILFVARQRC